MHEKVILVTGASRGLGHALAEALAAEGHFVYSGVRNTQKAPAKTVAVWLDLENEESLHQCVEKILKEKGRIDLVINNAGVAYWGAVDSMTLQEVRSLFEVNVFGTFRLMQLIIPHMRKNASGQILFISSIRGVESCAYMGVYSASKAALEAIAFDWAVTLQKWNIFVSVAQPGPMDTGIEIKHGSYYKSEKDNPYLPYGEVSLKWQPVQEACRAILEHLKNPNPPFKFQTNSLSTDIISNHLKDPSGNAWYQQQKQWVNQDPLNQKLTKQLKVQ